ncbi:myelin-associated oligodendrocyte basic protein [Thomomys bottae]
MSQKMAKEGPRLSKNQKFSEHFSIHCCPPFTFLNSKREIVDRKYSICKSGCFYQKKEEDWICCACQKTRRRAKSPQRPQPRPATPPAVIRAPTKPRSPPRAERQPRPRPEVRSPPPPPAAKQRPRQKVQQPSPRRSPLRGSGPGRGASPNKASRF